MSGKTHRLIKVIIRCSVLLILTVLFCIGVVLSGNYFLNQHKYNTARQVLQIATTLHIQTAQSYSDIGDTYYEQHNFSAAEKQYIQALKYSSLNNKCTLYTKLGDTQYNQAVGDQSATEKIHYLSAATESYQLCLQMQPNNTTAKAHQDLAKKDLEKLKQSQDEEAKKNAAQTTTKQSQNTNLPSNQSQDLQNNDQPLTW